MEAWEPQTSGLSEATAVGAPALLIDQNLDAVNAEKVARMIRRNSSTAQFVQISLRKVSLKEADHLVGVTMTPESLSEVIMRVNLADIEDEKPTEVIPA